MTEAEWLAATDPAPMFNELGAGASPSKLRLFACACARVLWQTMTEEDRAFVEMAERQADGLLPLSSLYVAAGRDAHTGLPAPRQAHKGRVATGMVGEMASSDAWGSTRRVRSLVVDAVRSSGASRVGEWQRQSDLLRCVFGNPFRAAILDPAWLAWNGGTVGRLAEIAYQERELPSGHLSTDRLALAADALEDAGCADAEILGHLRSAGPHVRGCWAVDLLTSRS